MVETCYIIAGIAIISGILTDLKSGLIPYAVTIPLLCFALIIAILNGTLLIGILSATLSFLILWITAMITTTNCWNKKEVCLEHTTVGGGDIKFASGLGLLIASPLGVLVFLAVSFASATIFSLISDVKKIKMGHWLALGFCVSIWGI
tara:strand:- start:435 stop:878 length:444 start_codon:yes stop_codon:yes gene_type:complete